MLPSPKGQILFQHSEQHAPFYWIQQANWLWFWQVELKKKTEHPSKLISVILTPPQEGIQKVQFMHLITTEKQPAKNYLPHWLLHNHFWLFFSAAFGQKGQGNVITSAFWMSAQCGQKDFKAIIRGTVKRLLPTWSRWNMGPQLEAGMSWQTSCSSFCCAIWLPVRWLTLNVFSPYYHLAAACSTTE